MDFMRKDLIAMLAELSKMNLIVLDRFVFDDSEDNFNYHIWIYDYVNSKTITSHRIVIFETKDLLTESEIITKKTKAEMLHKLMNTNSFNEYLKTRK